jgi:hypothetical protein
LLGTGALKNKRMLLGHSLSSFHKKCLFIVAVNKLINWYMGAAPSGSIPDTTVLSESDKNIKQSRVEQW